MSSNILRPRVILDLAASEMNGFSSILKDPELLIEFTGLMSCVFANGLRDWGSIAGRVIPKTQKMVLDAALLSSQLYKVMIKGKVARSSEQSSTPHYTTVQQILKREPSDHPGLRSPTLLTQCHTQKIPFKGSLIPFALDTFTIFKVSPTKPITQREQIFCMVVQSGRKFSFNSLA